MFQFRMTYSTICKSSLRHIARESCHEGVTILDTSAWQIIHQFERRSRDVLVPRRQVRAAFEFPTEHERAHRRRRPPGRAIVNKRMLGKPYIGQFSCAFLPLQRTQLPGQVGARQIPVRASFLKIKFGLSLYDISRLSQLRDCGFQTSAILSSFITRFDAR